MLKKDEIAEMLFANNKKAHLIGAAGSGMQSLAQILLRWRWNLTGSDQQWAEQLEHGEQESSNRIIQAASHLPEDTELVIYSAAIDPHHPQRIETTNRCLANCSYPEFIGLLSSRMFSVAIAGSHGKSTVCAMIRQILKEAKVPAISIFGAQLIEKSGVVEVQKNLSGKRVNELFVVEACEYRQHFLKLQPNVAVILNIELDHFDCYATEEELISAFFQFAERLPSDGHLIVNTDCPAARLVAQAASCNVIRISCNSADHDQHVADDFRGARILNQQAGKYCFQVSGSKNNEPIQLQVFGRHNVENALAAMMVAETLDIPAESITGGLESFTGLRRRLQHRGSIRYIREGEECGNLLTDRSETEQDSIELYDDYAHHPTEVLVSLRAIREIHPERRIVCVFQPHQAIRTAYLLDELAISLQNADYVIVADIFRARESLDQYQNVTAAKLAGQITAAGVMVADYHEMEIIKQQLPMQLLPNDVVVVMGAGDLWKITDELFKWDRKLCPTG